MNGVIFHWGLYSVPAFCPLRKKDGLNNGSEWYLKRLKETGKFRPIFGWKETQEYHKNNFEDKTYEDFKDLFIVNDFNPDIWMNMCKKINAKYVILTVKHHDGFCLWNTKTTNYNSYESAAKKDLLKIFVDSAKKHNLKVGIYYSWSEFNKGVTKEYLKIINKQIDELLFYNPDIWWFDGDWACKTKCARETISNICKKLKEYNPDVKINDRVCLNDKDTHKNYTYRNYGDRFIPTQHPTEKWEHINTVGYSWGFNKNDKYKSHEELFNVYKNVKEYNGNFLLNLSPDKDGIICENEINVFNKLGEMIHVYDNEIMKNKVYRIYELCNFIKSKDDCCIINNIDILEKIKNIIINNNIDDVFDVLTFIGNINIDILNEDDFREIELIKLCKYISEDKNDYINIMTKKYNNYKT